MVGLDSGRRNVRFLPFGHTPGKIIPKMPRVNARFAQRIVLLKWPASDFQAKEAGGNEFLTSVFRSEVS